MSIKNKLVTAVTTAGLLAGLFGSAFVPAARAAADDLDVVEFKAELIANESGAYNTGTGAGTASDPIILYAPISNDGGAFATAIDEAFCTFIDDADIETNADVDWQTETGNPVVVTISSTNGLLIDGADDADGFVFDDDESAYETGTDAYEDVSMLAGISFCAAIGDDDDAYGSVITVEVDGIVAAEIHVRVMGYATSITASNDGGTWVSMDGAAGDDEFSLVFKDKTGTSLQAYDDISDTDIEDYANDHTAGDLSYFVDDYAVGDSESALIQEGTGLEDAEVAANFCDSDVDSVGDSKTIVFGVIGDGGTVRDDANDIISNALTVKCSDDGADAEITGVEAVDTTVLTGSYTKIKVTFEDGSGNPQGMGGNAYDLNILEVLDLDGGTDMGGNFYPAELDSAGAEWSLAGARLYEVTATGACSSAVADYADDATDLSGDVVDGVAYLCYRSSLTKTGKNTVVITADSYNGATTALDDQAQYTVVFTVSGDPAAGAGSATIVAGPKLKTATITISAAAGKLVTVTIEKVSTGKTFTYYRKANASGVAKFTIRRAGTWEVFASYGDDVTDTVTLKK